MTNTDVHLLAGAYALDALDDDERRAFETHLSSCADCSAEVAELQETGARLAALTVETPPESLRARVLADAASTRQLPPTPSAARADTTPTALAWMRRLALPVAAALLAVLALSLGAVAMSQRDRADRLSAQADLVSSVLTAPDARSTTARLGSGQATLVSSEEREAAVLVATGVDAPPDDRVLELWRVDAAGKAVPAGIHRPAADGTLAVPVEGSMSDVSAIAVTVEPAGGSQSASTTPIASFALS